MADKPSPSKAGAFPWLMVLCLVGLDYFSTLAYLPSIAVAAAGQLAPLAALGVVAITLLFAVPVYLYVVGRSPHGHGATGLLDELVRGWYGKMLILVLLGFVATDFVITRTLSVADAASHLLHNPLWDSHVEKPARELLTSTVGDIVSPQVGLTLSLTVICFGLWAFLTAGFTRSFLRLAVVVVAFYFLVITIVLAGGLLYLAFHADLFTQWTGRLHEQLVAHGGPEGNIALTLLALSLLWFPQMALGLSGFELSMASAPLIEGKPDDDPQQPRGRIHNTRKMMLVAAVVMCVYILASSLVVTLLVPEKALEPGGPAADRALAYLAHGDILGAPFGLFFGTLYDLSTVMILCLAGASAAIGFRDLVPYYLARYGMQPRWAARVNVVILLFNIVILVVILAFRANVTAQQWAYATSVLVLLTSASIAAFLDLRHRMKRSLSRFLVTAPFLIISVFFLFMAVRILFMPEGGYQLAGLLIALAFVLSLLIAAFISRWMRSTELRFQGFAFADDETKARWEVIRLMEFQVLVPHDPTSGSLARKEHVIREEHRLAADVPIIFIEAELGDPSEFYHTPTMRIVREDGREIIRVSRCSSIPHVIAAIALEFREVGRPPEIHFAWLEDSAMLASLSFLFLGRGNIPWLVHELVRKAEPKAERRPRVVIG